MAYDPRTTRDSAGTQTGWLDRVPRPLLALLELACVGVGAYLLIRPLTSLSTLIVIVGAGLIVSGTADLLAGRREGGRNPSTWVAVAWIVAGIVVVVWPGLSIRLLALVVGVALIISGVGKGIDAFRGSTLDERIADGLLALANVVFGVLALSWPDVTLLVVAVIFGTRLIWFGLTHLWNAFRQRQAGRTVPADEEPTTPPRSRFHRWARVAGALAALVIALALAGVSAQLNRGTPIVDDFYTAPESVPAEPGALLRSEDFTRDVPDGAEAWRILYTTTRDDSTPALSSAIVVVPEDGSASPFPVIAWAHGTTGFSESSAPSLAPHPFEAGAFFLLDKVIAKGWALVATDYIGLGTAGPHPYLIGQGEGRSVLDAVRAAKQLEPDALSGETVVWGHSQGGHAALWTGILAPTYAPDANVIGVAALAPASDLIGLVENFPNLIGSSVFASYVIAAYSQIYPDVGFSTYIRPAARVIVEEMSKRSLFEPGIFVSILKALTLSKDPDIFAADPTTGALGERLRENIPTGGIEAPLLIGQGLSDPLVVPAVQEEYVAARRGAGQELLYLTYDGLDHVGLVRADSPLIPELISWTQDRLAGKPSPSNCETVDAGADAAE